MQAATASEPQQTSPGVPAHAFKPGHDPRRNVSGSGPRASTLAARAELEARAKEFVDGLIALTKDDVNAEPCALCGRGKPRADEVKIKAIVAALDRAGISVDKNVNVRVSQDASWVDALEDDELFLLRDLKERAMARLAKPVQALPESTER